MTDPKDFKNFITNVSHKTIYNILRPIYGPKRSDILNHTTALVDAIREQLNTRQFHKIMLLAHNIIRIDSRGFDKNVYMHFYILQKPEIAMSIPQAKLIPANERSKYYEFGVNCPLLEQYRSKMRPRILEQLNLWKVPFGFEIQPFIMFVIEFLLIPSNVTELQLIGCVPHEEDVIPLQYYPNLKSLNLANNSNLRGLRMPNLPHLRRLCLSGCTAFLRDRLFELVRYLYLDYLDLGETNFTEMPIFLGGCGRIRHLRLGYVTCSYVPQLLTLKSLELVESGLLSEHRSLLSTLAESTRCNLERLKIIGSVCVLYPAYQLEILKLDKLRCLHLDHLVVTDYFFEDVSRHLLQLEEFAVECCINLITSQFLNIVRNCKKLVRINIRYCRNVKCTAITDIIPILERREQEGYPLKKPVIVLADGTWSKLDVRNNLAYRRNPNLLRISLYVGTPCDVVFDVPDVFDVCTFE